MCIKPAFLLSLQDLKDVFNSPCRQKFPDLGMMTFSIWRFKVLKTALVFRRLVTDGGLGHFLVSKTHGHLPAIGSGGLGGNLFTRFFTKFLLAVVFYFFSDVI